MKKILFIAIVLQVLTSCVSKEKYERAQNNANYYESEYNDLTNQYNNLVNEYNKLKKMYNGLVDDYNDLEYDVNRLENIIRRAHSATNDLENDFYYFIKGRFNVDADDIEDDIDEIRSKLNGWL